MVTGLPFSLKFSPVDGLLLKSQTQDFETVQPISFGEILRAKEKQLEQEISVSSAVAALATRQTSFVIMLPMLDARVKEKLYQADIKPALEKGLPRLSPRSSSLLPAEVEQNQGVEFAGTQKNEEQVNTTTSISAQSSSKPVKKTEVPGVDESASTLRRSNIPSVSPSNPLPDLNSEKSTGENNSKIKGPEELPNPKTSFGNSPTVLKARPDGEMNVVSTDLHLHPTASTAINTVKVETKVVQGEESQEPIQGAFPEHRVKQLETKIARAESTELKSNTKTSAVEVGSSTIRVARSDANTAISGEVETKQEKVVFETTAEDAKTVVSANETPKTSDVTVQIDENASAKVFSASSALSSESPAVTSVYPNHGKVPTQSIADEGPVNAISTQLEYGMISTRAAEITKKTQTEIETAGAQTNKPVSPTTDNLIEEIVILDHDASIPLDARADSPLLLSQSDFRTVHFQTQPQPSPVSVSIEPIVEQENTPVNAKIDTNMIYPVDGRQPAAEATETTSLLLSEAVQAEQPSIEKFSSSFDSAQATETLAVAKQMSSPAKAVATRSPEHVKQVAQTRIDQEKVNADSKTSKQASGLPVHDRGRIYEPAAKGVETPVKVVTAGTANDRDVNKPLTEPALYIKAPNTASISMPAEALQLHFVENRETTLAETKTFEEQPDATAPSAGSTQRVVQKEKASAKFASTSNSDTNDLVNKGTVFPEAEPNLLNSTSLPRTQLEGSQEDPDGSTNIPQTRVDHSKLPTQQTTAHGTITVDKQASKATPVLEISQSYPDVAETKTPSTEYSATEVQSAPDDLANPIRVNSKELRIENIKATRQNDGIAPIVEYLQSHVNVPVNSHDTPGTDSELITTEIKNRIVFDPVSVQQEIEYKKVDAETQGVPPTNVRRPKMDNASPFSVGEIPTSPLDGTEVGGTKLVERSSFPAQDNSSVNQSTNNPVTFWADMDKKDLSVETRKLSVQGSNTDVKLAAFRISTLDTNPEQEVDNVSAQHTSKAERPATGSVLSSAESLSTLDEINQRSTSADSTKAEQPRAGSLPILQELRSGTYTEKRAVSSIDAQSIRAETATGNATSTFTPLQATNLIGDEEHTQSSVKSVPNRTDASLASIPGMDVSVNPETDKDTPTLKQTDMDPTYTSSQDPDRMNAVQLDTNQHSIEIEANAVAKQLSPEKPPTERSQSAADALESSLNSIVDTLLRNENQNSKRIYSDEPVISLMPSEQNDLPGLLELSSKNVSVEAKESTRQNEKSAPLVGNLPTDITRPLAGEIFTETASTHGIKETKTENMISAEQISFVLDGPEFDADLLQKDLKLKKNGSETEAVGSQSNIAKTSSKDLASNGSAGHANQDALLRPAIQPIVLPSQPETDYSQEFENYKNTSLETTVAVSPASGWHDEAPQSGTDVTFTSDKSIENVAESLEVMHPSLGQDKVSHGEAAHSEPGVQPFQNAESRKTVPFEKETHTSQASVQTHKLLQASADVQRTNEIDVAGKSPEVSHQPAIEVSQTTDFQLEHDAQPHQWIEGQKNSVLKGQLVTSQPVTSTTNLPRAEVNEVASETVVAGMDQETAQKPAFQSKAAQGMLYPLATDVQETGSSELQQETSFENKGVEARTRIFEPLADASKPEVLFSRQVADHSLEEVVPQAAIADMPSISNEFDVPDPASSQAEVSSGKTISQAEHDHMQINSDAFVIDTSQPVSTQPTVSPLTSVDQETVSGQRQDIKQSFPLDVPDQKVEEVISLQTEPNLERPVIGREYGESQAATNETLVNRGKPIFESPVARVPVYTDSNIELEFVNSQPIAQGTSFRIDSNQEKQIASFEPLENQAEVKVSRANVSKTESDIPVRELSSHVEIDSKIETVRTPPAAQETSINAGIDAKRPIGYSEQVENLVVVNEMLSHMDINDEPETVRTQTIHGAESHQVGTNQEGPRVNSQKVATTETVNESEPRKKNSQPSHPVQTDVREAKSFQAEVKFEKRTVAPQAFDDHSMEDRTVETSKPGSDTPSVPTDGSVSFQDRPAKVPTVADLSSEERTPSQVAVQPEQAALDSKTAEKQLPLSSTVMQATAKAVKENEPITTAVDNSISDQRVILVTANHELHTHKTTAQHESRTEINDASFVDHLETFVPVQPDAPIKVDSGKQDFKADPINTTEEKITPVEKQYETDEMPENPSFAANSTKEPAVIGHVEKGLTGQFNPHSIEVVQQVIHHLNGRLRSGPTSMHLQLNPESLGAIDVEVVRDVQGVSVTFFVEHSSTGKLLESQLGQLRQSLAESGVQLSGLNIGQQSHFGQEGGFQHRNTEFAQHSSRQHETFQSTSNPKESPHVERVIGQASEVDYLI